MMKNIRILLFTVALFGFAFAGAQTRAVGFCYGSAFYAWRYNPCGRD